MIRSPETKIISKAILNVHAEITNPERNTKGHGYMYAELDQVLEIALPLWIKHGLTFFQFLESDDKGDYNLTTLMEHPESGEWIESSVILPLKIPAMGVPLEQLTKFMQGLGSCVTYLRRYTITAIFDMAQKDMDGEIESVNRNPQKNVLATASAPSPTENETISEKQLYSLQSLCKNPINAGVEQRILKEQNITSLSKLSKPAASSYISRLKGNL